MNQQQYLTFEEAGSYLSIPKKYLENYSKAGGEFPLERVGRKKLISKSIIDQWKAERDFGSAQVNRDDYLKCLEFAVKSFYQYRSTSDFGTSQQRDAGKFVSNFVLGKLGEIALQRFLKKNFDVDSSLDFDLRDAVVGQDITEIAKPRRGGRVYNPLKLRLAVKTSKMKNVWLIVPGREVEDAQRSSDIYIFTRVDLYLNHFIRILKEHNALASLSDIIPSFETMSAEVCGFVKKDELTADKPVTELPLPKQKIQLSYIIRSGDLHRSRAEWEQLISEL